MSSIVISPAEAKWRTWVNENQGLGTWDDDRNWLWHFPTNYVANVEEEVATSDFFVNDLAVEKIEPLSILAQKSARPHLTFEENILASDSLSNTLVFNREIEESFALTEVREALIGKNCEEIFLLKDEIRKNIEQIVRDALILHDLCERRISWIRDYSEVLSLDSTKNEKDISVFKAQTISFYDAIKEVARGVLSDIFIQSGIWSRDTLDKFVRNGGRHVGYTTFKEFITGDYEYQKALFRLAIESTSADRGLVEQIDISIDVDDVYDRGSCTVTDRNYGGNVQFSRPFSIAPEVTVTMRSGNALTAIRPVVTNVTTAGFNVMLYDVEGQKTTGTFTWTAAGY